jgi:hypothetical protein
MYKFVFFVPIEDAQKVKNAVFEAGAGKMDGYDCCCFEYIGRGQFRPGKESNPHIGKQNQLEFVEELKVETVCKKDKMREVLSAFRDAHPYEVPAFDIFETIDPQTFK